MKTILLIEDDESFRFITRGILRGERYQIAEAPTGEEGLALVEDFDPDVILLDLHLPDARGEDVLRELARAPAPREPPAMVLSPVEIDHERPAQPGLREDQCPP